MASQLRSKHKALALINPSSVHIHIMKEQIVIRYKCALCKNDNRQDRRLYHKVCYYMTGCPLFTHYKQTMSTSVHTDCRVSFLQISD